MSALIAQVRALAEAMAEAEGTTLQSQINRALLGSFAVLVIFIDLAFIAASVKS